jgi:subtilisin family serine protease
MVKKSSERDKVTFYRGGVRVTLQKVADRFAVKLKSGEVLERLPDRLLQNAELSPGVRTRVRYWGRYPGQRTAIFCCPSKQRDVVMKSLRKQKDWIQYCSHVLRRSEDEAIPTEDIGLDDKLFVEFTEPPDRKNLKKIQEKHGLRAIWRFPEKPAGVVFQLTQAATRNPLKISNDLRKMKICKEAEPCLIDVKSVRMLPNDPKFDSQWHLLNTGQGGGLAGADCNAVEAWDYTWGAGIVVALIDDGFDLAHPDFSAQGKVFAPYDASQRDTDPSPAEFNDNHGTACAGVAVASRGVGLTVGIAPDSRLMPIRHAGRLGDFEEALAFYHAYVNSADVISCSWGVPDHQSGGWPMPSLTQYVVDICVTSGRNGRGIPIFFAAGNGYEPLELCGYANHPEVIAVAACTNEDEKSWYSDYGENVWITAPSSGGTLSVTTTDRTGSLGYSRDDYTHSFGGTSSAAPLVAGVAALMLSVNTNLTVTNIKEILRNTAVKIQQGNPQDRQDYWGNTYNDAYNGNGHSIVYGWGRVDAGAAVQAALP